jgi:Flp pilus assembly protein TadD
MPVRASCPACHSECELADHVGSQLITCARCQHTFAAVPRPEEAPLDVVEVVEQARGPAENAITTSPGGVVHTRGATWQEEEPRLRRRIRRHAGEEAPPKPRSHLWLIVGVVVGSVALLVCAAVGAAVLIVRTQRSAPNDWAAAASLRRGSTLLEQGRYREAEVEFREAVRLKPDHAVAHNNLGWALNCQDRNVEAEAELREAIRLDPNSAMAHSNLSGTLSTLGRFPEAETEAREAIRVKPGLAIAHNNLGLALQKQGQFHDAEAAYHKAIQLDPGDAIGHSNLGYCLSEQGRLREAEPACREAIRLKPGLATAHANLGMVLDKQGRLQEAETETREALRLKPDLAIAHSNLGMILSDQGRHKESEEECRHAIRLQPDSAPAHNNLGLALQDQQRPKEAEVALREAIRLQPGLAAAHSNLGLALTTLGRQKEAEAECREAIRLRPDMARAHNNLGLALLRQSRFREAEAAFREAIRHQPDDALAMCNLGIALQDQGRLTEALQHLRRGHEIGQRIPAWRWPSADWVRACEQLVELDRKLLAVLAGDSQPADAAERADLVEFCLERKRLAVAAARVAMMPCADDAKLDQDQRQAHLYGGARAAAQAAGGRGADALRLPDKVRIMLRRQALHWLRAGLANAKDELERGNAAAGARVHRQLTHWQQDLAFISVRTPRALNALPDSEREEWQDLWADVEALNRRAVAAK